MSRIFRNSHLIRYRRGAPASAALSHQPSLAIVLATATFRRPPAPAPIAYTLPHTPFPLHANPPLVLHHDLTSPASGLLWRTGYENGAIVCPLYDDVHPALTRWHLEGKKLYIYSSGSIAAQKLLFAHTNCNPKDINVLFENYYDTTNAGMKQEQQSYSTIAEKESIPAEDWLFLSDNVKEVEAARAAGMKSRVVLREGNAEVSAEDKEKLGAVEEFSGL